MNYQNLVKDLYEIQNIKICISKNHKDTLVS